MNWTPINITSTGWTPSPQGGNSTYAGNLVVDKGCLMDDTIYQLDDSVVTISDKKISPNSAPATVWI